MLKSISECIQHMELSTRRNQSSIHLLWIFRYFNPTPWQMFSCLRQKCIELRDVLYLESWAAAKVQLFGTCAPYEVETSRHSPWKAFYSLLPQGESKDYIYFEIST